MKARGILRVIIAADESPDTFALTRGRGPASSARSWSASRSSRTSSFEVVRAPGYADRIPMLLRGEGDVIAAIFDTPDRREKVAFTTEVIPTHNVAVTLPPRARIGRVEDLRAVKIGVIRGAQPAEAAAEAGVKSSDLVAYETMEDLLRGLKAREVGAAVLPISELALASKRVAGPRGRDDGRRAGNGGLGRAQGRRRPARRPRRIPRERPPQRVLEPPRRAVLRRSGPGRARPHPLRAR